MGRFLQQRGHVSRGGKKFVEPSLNTEEDESAERVSPGSEASEVPQQPRSDLVTTAVRFLENPKIQSSPISQKRAFLLRKGLTNEEIDCAIKQARPTATVADQRALVPAPGPPPLPPRPLPVQYAGAEQTIWSYLRDISSTAAVLGFACYGVYYLYKKYLEPYLSHKGWIKQDDQLTKVLQEVSALTAAVQQLKEAVKSLEGSLGNEQRMLRETESVDAVKHDAALSDLKSEVQSIKGLLLSRKQFPDTPKAFPSIPTWQLKTEEASKENGVENPEEEHLENVEESGDHTNGESSTISSPVTVIGAATGDIVVTVKELPVSGADCEAQDRGYQIGGSAFNVIRALVRLNIPVINGITVGNGLWGERVEAAMSALKLPVLLRHQQRDNGWCLALVEPDGERTFISIPGCEEVWRPEMLSALPAKTPGIIYASGYELSCPDGQVLQQWLLNTSADQTLVLDLGPRISHIDPTFIEALPPKRTILTLNRDEITQFCGEGDPVSLAVQYATQHQVTIVVRLGQQGAWLCGYDQAAIQLPAYQVSVVDTIGAGDAHVGGMLAGMSSGLSLAEAVDMGNRVAAIVVSRLGSAGAPAVEELENFAFSPCLY
ncbi:uncharacterized sugar kinase YegV-like isoform X2 [Ornithodoros turicata]|uniref:uncharacterized sugar kinase YegV-like isoform X2 n=1 Tax=Ornithodoros turicata TaxID=34597 RepID=UPI003138C03C